MRGEVDAPRRGCHLHERREVQGDGSHLHAATPGDADVGGNREHIGVADGHDEVVCGHMVGVEPPHKARRFLELTRRGT